jgi:hypothetical protein
MRDLFSSQCTGGSQSAEREALARALPFRLGAQCTTRIGSIHAQGARQALAGGDRGGGGGGGGRRPPLNGRKCR